MGITFLFLASAQAIPVTSEGLNQSSVLQYPHIRSGRQYFEDFRSTDSPVLFAYHGKRYQAQLKRNAVEFRLPQRQHRPDTVFRMVFQGARPEVEIVPQQKLTSVSHYILPQSGRSSGLTVERYNKILYRNLYKNIDVLFYLKDKGVEYDFILHPGADPSQIRLGFDQLERVQLSETGLRLFRHNRHFHLSSPKAWQIKDGKRQLVSVNYKLSRQSSQDNGSIRVTLVTSPFDPEIDLVIDPVLTHLTYLGGSGDDEITDLALDASGDLYVLGVTQSVNFPVSPTAFQGALAGSGDIFVSKYRVDKNGFTELFSTYIGGNNADFGNAIVLDSQGNLYVGGTTQSLNFPVPASIGATGFRTSFQGGSRDGFIIRLDTTGSNILAGSFIGGSGVDEVKGIAVLGDGSLYISGQTDSTNLSVLNALQSELAGKTDVFFQRLNATLSTLIAGSYYGGSDNDFLQAMAVDTSDRLYLGGITTSNNLPLKQAIQSTNRGNGDGFIVRVSSNNILDYSTYVGGKFRDSIDDVTVDSAGKAVALGFTESPDLNVTSQNVWQPSIADDTSVLDPRTGSGADPLNPIGDLFIAKLNATGSTYNYLSYIGGLGFEQPGSLAVDQSGRVILTGSTTSANLFDRFLSGNANAAGNAFAAMFDLSLPGSSALLLSSIMDGNQPDIARALVSKPAGNEFFVAGRTESDNLPTLNALQTQHGGSVSDGFITKFGIGADVEAFVGFQQGTVVPIGKNMQSVFVYSVINNGPDPATNIQIEMTIPRNAQFDELVIRNGIATCSSTQPDQNSKIFCTVSQLLDTEAARIDVKMTPKDLVQLDFGIHAQADQPDTDPTNNTGSFTTIVANFPGEGNTGVPNALLKPGTGGSLFLVDLLILFWFRDSLIRLAARVHIRQD